MKRAAAILSALAILLLPLFSLAEAAAYSVCEQSTARELYGDNVNIRLPMASTTKIMTCLVALESSSPDEVVTAVPEAVGIEGSSMYLKSGETLTMEELLYGLMLASGNDAACAIALHISGSIDRFCELMNARAREMGAVNTHFTSPNGLPDEEHYTTAHDLALIACTAMKDPDFRKIVGTKEKNLPADGDSPARYLRNKNKILYLYEGGNGVKTGYTRAAGKCLVSGAQREDMQLIAVVLNDSDMFADSMALMDKAFEEYSMRTVVGKGELLGEADVTRGTADRVRVEAAEEISLPLAEKEYNIVTVKLCVSDGLTAPIRQGDRLGRLDVFIGDELAASTDAVAGADVSEKNLLYKLKSILSAFIGRGGRVENSEIFGIGGSGFEKELRGADI